jgi:glycosyltransferase involved in cell wall biosynthesis
MTSSSVASPQLSPADPRVAAPLSVALVSTVSSHGPGGLSAYVRHLRRGLPGDWAVSEAARFAVEGPGRVDYAAAEPERLHGAGPRRAVQVLAPRAPHRLALSRVHHLVNRRPLAPAGIAAFSAAYRRSLAAAVPSDADVVHYVGAGWELLGFPALAAARRRRAAFAVTPAIHPASWGDSELDARLYRAADAVFALSEFERRHLIGLGVAADKVRVTPLGPVVEAAGDGARFRREHGLGDRPIVLFVARKQRYKGYHGLCEAMSEVVRAIPGACLVSAGQDAEPPYPPIPDRAHLDLGLCNETQKADALAACDVFCMPSSGESLGISYLEAWAHGKPVVAGMAPAVTEIVRDGETGFCTEPDPDSISAVLVRLLSDRALRERLGSAGQELQRARYTWDAVTEIHAEVYERLVQAR